MSRVVVPDNCLGLDLANGRSYDARHGVVDVAPEDMAQLPGSIAGQYGFLHQGVTFTRAAGRTCACGFSAFDWQSRCPRCGRRIIR